MTEAELFAIASQMAGVVDGALAQLGVSVVIVMHHSETGVCTLSNTDDQSGLLMLRRAALKYAEDMAEGIVSERKPLEDPS